MTPVKRSIAGFFKGSAMKIESYRMEKGRLAVSALRNAQLYVMLWLFALASLLWSLEIRRLVGVAHRAGWTVRFVASFPGDTLDEAAGMAIHRDKVILLRTAGMTRRKLASVLRHELEHQQHTGRDVPASVRPRVHRRLAVAADAIVQNPERLHLLRP